jgi:hypothetical protein
MRTSTVPLTLVAVLFAAVPARSDEEAVARARKVLAALPAPSAEKGYDWEVQFVINGQPFGGGRFKAEPGGEGDEAGWKCSEDFALPVAGMKHRSQEFTRRDLTTVEGEESDSGPKESKEASWERTASGYTLESKRGDAQATKQVEAPEGAVHSMASLLLFCRMVPAEPAVYEVPVLEANPDEDEGPLEAATIRVVGAGKWEWDGKTTDAFVVEYARGGKAGSLYFDAKTRAPLAIKMQDPPITLVSKGQAKAGIDFSAPAKTAKLGAARAALAFGTGDFELLSEVVHWETAAERVSAATGEAADAESLRASLEGKLPKHAPREEVEAALLVYFEKLEETVDDKGDTVVKFPPEFKSLELKVREFDGVWKLVEFPPG